MFTLEDIIRTLNSIEVHGKENMDKLLGVILALEAMQQAQSNPSKKEEGE